MQNRKCCVKQSMPMVSEYFRDMQKELARHLANNNIVLTLLRKILRNIEFTLINRLTTSLGVFYTCIPEDSSFEEIIWTSAS